MRPIRIILWIAAIASAAMPLRAQTPIQPLSYEVASIKLNNSEARNSSVSFGTHFNATNETLKRLILFSNHLFDAQLIGGPDWINSVRFDIQATTLTI